MVNPSKVHNFGSFTKDLSERSGVPISSVAKVLHSMYDSVCDAVSKNEAISLRGFGTFRPCQRKATVYRTPVLQTPVEKAATISPSLRFSGEFKDRVYAASTLNEGAEA